MQVLLGPEVMSTSCVDVTKRYCADVIITLLRNGIVRNDETPTNNIFLNCIL